MKRYGWVIGLKAEELEEYKRLHANVWQNVLRMIKACHIQNYSIYLRQLPYGNHYLFNCLEYTGKDFTADMAKIAADPTTQKLWSVCIPCQQPLRDRKKGELWAEMEEVFHSD